MGAKALISVGEYLHTDYSPDCDYVDGELVDRNVVEFDHADLQTEIAAYLRGRYRRAAFVTVVEQGVQVSATRFRVPDVCIMRDPALAADHPHTTAGHDRDLIAGRQS